MSQLTVKDLKAAIEGMDESWPVFFRRVPPICGNIESAYSAEKSEYSFFGIVEPCLIIEPAKDDESDEVSQ